MATPRTYDSLLTEHLTGHRRMAFVSGPRQVGKTTTCRLHAHAYINWDDIEDRELILSGPANLIGTLKLDRLSETVPVLLVDRSARQLVYGNLSRQVRVSVDTIRRWIAALCGLHLGFVVRPWFANVSRSLRKEPKWYLRDWASIENVGRRAETLVACHLLTGWLRPNRFDCCAGSTRRDGSSSNRRAGGV